MITVEGKNNVYAKVVADSISKSGKRITTFEVQFHRWVLSELNTHRMISKNGSSSRAIPFTTAVDLVRKMKVQPLKWGMNQAGMQAKDQEVDNPKKAMFWWNVARWLACFVATRLHKAGLHKQWVSRLLETFTMQKMVLTATEWENFFWLRCHPDAQPEIRELAECMQIALERSKPTLLMKNEWHVPYFENGVWNKKSKIPLEDALKISASCCAQVSFRKNDDTIEKAHQVWERLVGSQPIHASPFEHIAKPIVNPGKTVWEEGITHLNKNGQYGSGNLYGWIQYRQLIDGHTKEG